MRIGILLFREHSENRGIHLDILSVLFRVCFVTLCSSISTELNQAYQQEPLLGFFPTDFSTPS